MFFGLFRKSPEKIAEEAERDAGPRQSTAALHARHARLLDRCKTAGIDPGTILLLIQLFGPLIVALVERLLKRLDERSGQ